MKHDHTKSLKNKRTLSNRVGQHVFFAAIWPMWLWAAVHVESDEICISENTPIVHTYKYIGAEKQEASILLHQNAMMQDMFHFSWQAHYIIAVAHFITLTFDYSILPCIVEHFQYNDNGKSVT